MGNRAEIAHSLHGLGRILQSQGDLDAARHHLTESLTIRHGLARRLAISESLEGLAELAIEGGRAVRAARLFGAAEAIREEISAPLPPVQRAAYDRSVAAVRAALHEASFMAAWDAGRAMSLDQGVQDALEDR
jgi:hypothetical protein